MENELGRLVHRSVGQRYRIGWYSRYVGQTMVLHTQREYIPCLSLPEHGS